MLLVGSFSYDLLTRLVPACLITIQVFALADHGLQEFGQRVCESATSVTAKDVGVLMQKDRERLGKIGQKNFRRKKDFARVVADPFFLKLAQNNFGFGDAVAGRALVKDFYDGRSKLTDG